MDIVREGPPKAHAKGMKGGQRMGIVREGPPNTYARGGRISKELRKSG